MIYSKVHVCWSTDNTVTNVKPNSSSCADLNLDTSDPTHPITTPMYISGLENNVSYYFNVASMDQAGIVTYFLDATGAAAAAVGSDFSWKIALSAASPQGLTQAATPGPVYGLLDGQGCFIATAAYGSILAPEVNTFRKFRSEYLLKSKFGRLFVKTYYTYSPPLADFISNHPTLRFVARMFLFPILIFVKLALWMGLLPSVALIVLSILGLVIYKKSKRARGVI